MSIMNGHDDPKVTPFRRQRKEKPPREPVLNLPPVTQVLTLALIGAFLSELALRRLLGDIRVDAWVQALGFVNARYTQGEASSLPALVSPFTHIFLHGGWMHMGVNTLSLMAFGGGLEKWVGAKKFLAVFFGAALCGLLAHFAAAPDLPYPVIGASGAISGLFGALLLEMRARGHLGGSGLRGLAPFVILWLGTAVFFGAFGMPGAGAPVAWVVHVGGFLGGMVLWKIRPAQR